MITNSRSRSGKIYPYFVCSGRHNKYTDCKFRAVLIDAVEQKVEDLYIDHRLDPKIRDAFERSLILEFETGRQQTEKERDRLLKKQQRLLSERKKLLQAHYAEAIPLDLLKVEQDRIRGSLNQIADRLASSERSYAAMEDILVAALGFLQDGHRKYTSAPPTLRRLMNQALFTRIEVTLGGEVQGELAQPFSALLSRPVRSVATTIDWSDWEASFNEPEAPERAPGLSQTNMVGGTGLEPAPPWSYASPL